MERVTVNLSGKVRRATLNGREHYVVPLSMLVPGVLAGSRGALYYPAEEVARDPSIWNSIPITLHHPTRNGSHVSGRDPEVWEKSRLGHVFNARIDKRGRLIAEGWFDLEATRRIEPHILNMLEAGQPIELSTGLFTENIKAEPGANHGGRPYEYIARNYRADHLAVLLTEKGACSLQDGCGVLVNTHTHTHTTSLPLDGWHVVTGNAFDEGKIVRGPGGKFGSKGGAEETPAEKLKNKIQLLYGKKDGEGAEEGEEEEPEVDPTEAAREEWSKVVDPKLAKQMGVDGFLDQFPEYAKDFAGAVKNGPAADGGPSHMKYSTPGGEQFTLTGKTPRVYSAGAGTTPIPEGIQQAWLQVQKPGAKVRLGGLMGENLRPGDASYKRVQTEGVITKVNRDESGKVASLEVKGRTSAGAYTATEKGTFTIPADRKFDSTETRSSKDIKAEAVDEPTAAEPYGVKPGKRPAMTGNAAHWQAVLNFSLADPISLWLPVENCGGKGGKPGPCPQYKDDSGQAIDPVAGELAGVTGEYYQQFLDKELSAADLKNQMKDADRDADNAMGQMKKIRQEFSEAEDPEERQQLMKDFQEWNQTLLEHVGRHRAAQILYKPTVEMEKQASKDRKVMEGQRKKAEKEAEKAVAKKRAADANVDWSTANAANAWHAVTGQPFPPMPISNCTSYATAEPTGYPLFDYAAGSLDDHMNRVQIAFANAHPTELDPFTGEPKPACHLLTTFDDYVIYSKAGELYRQDYTTADDGTVTFAGESTEVRRVLKYEEVVAA